MTHDFHEVPADRAAFGMEIAYLSTLIGSNFEAQDLKGVDLKGANLTGCLFDRADLTGANLEDTILTNSSFRGANLTKANLRNAVAIKCDFSRANLQLVDFTDGQCVGSDFTMAYMKAALFLRTDMRASHFRRVTAKNTLFLHTDLRKTNFVGADLLGARFNGAKAWGMRNFDKAITKWWLSPWGGPPSYEPRPGWTELDRSVLGGISMRENAAKNPKG